MSNKIDKDFIIKEMSNMCLADITEYLDIKIKKKKEYEMNISGEIEEKEVEYLDIVYKDIKKLKPEQRKRIKNIYLDDGKVKFELFDKQRSLETLYKILSENNEYIGYDTSLLKDLSLEDLLKMSEEQDE